MNVTIAVPNDGKLLRELQMLIADEMTYSPDINVKLILDHRDYTAIQRAFLKDEKAEWLLLLHPERFPQSIPLSDLCQQDRDVTVFGGWMHAQDLIDHGFAEFPWRLNCFEVRDGVWADLQAAAGVMEIAGGSGSMLIARRVLQAVRLKQDRDGDRVRADLLFCKAATDHGFKVWGDFTEMCHEYKRVDLAALRDVAYMRDISHADREDINTPEYWDEQWRKMVKDEEEPDRRFYRDIIESLRKRREDKPAVDRKFSVLDFGCGTGNLLEALGEWNFNAHGVDISGEAIRVAESRGLNARQIKNDELFGKWDAVVCCEVLEHMQLGKAKALIEKFFSTATDYVLYTVPYNCMPPGAEPQHRTVFTLEKIAAITPHLKNVRKHGPWALVEAVKP